MHKNRKPLYAFLMIALMLFTACSSTPQVLKVSSQSAQTAALSQDLAQTLRGDARIKHLLAVLGKENISVDWTDARQNDGQSLVQIPLTNHGNKIEMISVSLNGTQITQVVLTRVKQNGDNYQLASADLVSGVVSTADYKVVNGKPSTQAFDVGKSANQDSTDSLFTVVKSKKVSTNSITAQQSCTIEATAFNAAIAWLISATIQAAADCAFWWAPPCWIAAANFAAASLNLAAAAMTYSNCINGGY